MRDGEVSLLVLPKTKVAPAQPVVEDAPLALSEGSAQERAGRAVPLQSGLPGCVGSVWCLHLAPTCPSVPGEDRAANRSPADNIQPRPAEEAPFSSRRGRSQAVVASAHSLTLRKFFGLPTGLNFS